MPATSLEEAPVQTMSPLKASVPAAYPGEAPVLTTSPEGAPHLARSPERAPVPAGSPVEVYMGFKLKPKIFFFFTQRIANNKKKILHFTVAQ